MLRMRKLFLAFLISICLTVASMYYLQPANCIGTCNREPCIECKPGEQKAGFPFPFVHSRPRPELGGESPSCGWSGTCIVFEGYLEPDIKPFLLNTFFYTILLLLVRSIFPQLYKFLVRIS